MADKKDDCDCGCGCIGIQESPPQATKEEKKGEKKVKKSK